MQIKDSTITKGFVLAATTNASVLIFSRFFTSPVIPAADPVVMSNFGMLMILVWGLAYLSVAKDYYKVKLLIAVFAVEKIIYGCVWVNWLLNKSVSAVYEKDKMAGIFFSVYGAMDWLFFLFFTCVFFRIITN